MGDFTARINFFERADRNISASFLQSSEKFFDEFWFYFIIGIYKGEIDASGICDAGVASAGKALILLVDEFDAGVFFSIRFSDLVGVIGRTVVY